MGGDLVATDLDKTHYILVLQQMRMQSSRRVVMGNLRR